MINTLEYSQSTDFHCSLNVPPLVLKEWNSRDAELGKVSFYTDPDL